ncbi:hypothetical protein EDB84DRAFT_1565246 [Lactarius hengduanensis]|nr:hypothetical protein EDB84DRAFT_1565246 [Lactarius hengduanensis]
MPKGITPIDPLYRFYTYLLIILIHLHGFDCSADVFDDPSASGFSLFGTVPDIIPTLTPDPGANGESPATEETDSVSLTLSPATKPLVSPGPAPVTSPAPTTIETQVESSPVSTGTPDTPMTKMSSNLYSNASDPTLDSGATSPSAATTGNGKKVEKKYACKKRMIPGGAKSARNICARDWCISHPEGTKGDFARYWDTLDADSKATYKRKEVDAKASAKATVAN